MKKSVPYVYYVKNKTTGLKYVGVKYSKRCDPKELWNTYFTSSKIIKKIIEIYGCEDFEFKVLKTFTCEHDAIQYERRLLAFAVSREDYVNIHINFVTDSKELYFNNKEKQKRIARFYGKLSYLQKLGFHKLTREQKKEVSSKGGYAAAIINKKERTGIFNPDVRERQHKTLKEKQLSAYYNPVTRKEICSSGGKRGNFSKFYCEKNGISEEERIKAQSDRGKRGGIKNKGFKWYTNGTESFKYTTNQQKELSFESFLSMNLQYKKGRTL